MYKDASNLKSGTCSQKQDTKNEIMPAKMESTVSLYLACSKNILSSLKENTMISHQAGCI
jgi:hypothetical protein